MKIMGCGRAWGRDGWQTSEEEVTRQAAMAGKFFGILGGTRRARARRGPVWLCGSLWGEGEVWEPRSPLAAGGENPFTGCSLDTLQRHPYPTGPFKPFAHVLATEGQAGGPLTFIL